MKFTTNKDLDFINKALNDVSEAFEEPIILRRYVSRTDTPTISGIAGVITYKNILTTAVIAEIGIESSAMAHGVYAAGDIVLQMRVKPTESNEVANHPGDRIIYKSVEYRLVQRAVPIHLQGIIFYKVVARRITTGG